MTTFQNCIVIDFYISIVSNNLTPPPPPPALKVNINNATVFTRTAEKFLLF